MSNKKLFLERFFQIVPMNSVIIVGGLAECIRSGNDPDLCMKAHADIDFLIFNDDYLSAAFFDEFKLLHYHHTATQFYFQIYHEESNIRADLFDANGQTPRALNFVNFQDKKVLIPSIESQMVKILIDLSVVLHGQSLEIKHFTTFNRLKEDADLKQFAKLFTTRDYEVHLGTDWRELYEKVLSAYEVDTALMPPTKIRNLKSERICANCIQYKNIDFFNNFEAYKRVGLI